MAPSPSLAAETLSIERDCVKEDAEKDEGTG